MADTTDEIIARVRRLDAAGTQKPWRRCGDARGGCECSFVWSEGADALVSTGRVEDLPPPPDAEVRANTELIASYRQDAPALADEVERLESEVQKLRRQVDCGKKDGDACEDCAVCWEVRAVRLEGKLSGARAAKRRWKALAKRQRQRWGAALLDEAAPAAECGALRDMVRRLAGYLESANELLESEYREDEEDCADSARLVAEARALIREAVPCSPAT